MQLLLVVVALAAASYSQTQTQTTPNISGTWELVEFDGNRDKSNPKFPKMTLIIEQESNKLKVTEKRIKQGQEEVRTLVYNLDGQGDTNTSRVELWRTESPKFESVTRIDKNRIVTEYKRELRLGTGYRPRDTASQQKDQWSIDASGKTLTLATKVLRMHSDLVTGANGQNGSQSPTTEFVTYKLKFRRVA
jgi:hypothetical protein